MDWDRELLDIIGVPRSILADIMPTVVILELQIRRHFVGFL